jgi:probable phosphoglycerate mutase
MAKTPHPPSTTVLLVRHGQTPTTGKVLPGRAKGLHLADAGHEQARIAADGLGA